MGTTIVGMGPIGTMVTDVGTQESVLGATAHIGTPLVLYEVHSLPTVPVLTPVPSEDVEMQEVEGLPSLSSGDEEAEVPMVTPVDASTENDVAVLRSLLEDVKDEDAEERAMITANQVPDQEAEVPMDTNQEVPSGEAPWTPPDFGQHPDDQAVLTPVPNDSSGSETVEQEAEQTDAEPFSPQQGMVPPEEFQEAMEVTPETPPGPEVPRGTTIERERAEKQARFCEEGDLPHPKRRPGRPVALGEPDEEPGSPRNRGNLRDAEVPQRGDNRPVPPMTPTNPLQEALLRASYAPIEEGGALAHNWVLACYYLYDWVSNCNLQQMCTPHPCLLGSVLISGDARIPNRFCCRFCHQDKGKGKNPKGGTHRFPDCMALMHHLVTYHLSPNQTQQAEEL
eukprot:3590876-Amphidinium_carterae.4